jgi:hypothetical protein
MSGVTLSKAAGVKAGIMLLAASLTTRWRRLLAHQQLARLTGMDFELLD